MRILISGAAGFLGSHLTDLLLAQGHEIVGVDNLITGKTPNIAHLSDNKRFTFLKHDVIEALAIGGTIDRIYHMASPASHVVDAVEDRKSTRLNSSHVEISYAVFCLKKKKKKKEI